MIDPHIYEPSHELNDFMIRASENMAKDYLAIQKRVKEDPGTAGSQGEEHWAALLRDWLPKTFEVRTCRRIVGYNGLASPQVDIVIFRPEYPTRLLEEKYVMAAGVLAAFECKITLRREHFHKFFENTRHIKQLANDRMGTPYRELQKPLLYGLLAHSHDWKNDDEKNKEAIQNKLIEYDDAIVKHPTQMPDLICIADLAAWSAMKHVSSWPLPENVDRKGIPIQMTQTSYSLHRKAVRPFSSIGALISSLWKKLAWEYPLVSPIADYFIEADTIGVLTGMPRIWSDEVYSPEVLNGLKNGYANNILGNEWCSTLW